MINRTTKYIILNVEYVIVVFILTGLIAFNKTFAYIGMGNIYITEYLTVLCLLSLLTKFLISRNLIHIDSKTIGSFILQFWPLIVILVYSFIRLYLDIDYGFQAIRHSLIFLYTILFLLLFIFSIRDEKQLFFILFYLLIIFSSLFNGVKIIIYKLLHYSFNYYEPERVFHSETDTICASVALLGLLVYHKIFWNKSKIGYLILIALNLIILFLTVKRSAIFGIVPAFGVYLFLIRKRLNLKKFYLTIVACGIFSLALLMIWRWTDHASLHHYVDYLFHKLSLTEKNTNWRLEAWKIGWDKFKQAPLSGIGYGPKIIELPVNNVDTNDPHNSFLAFLVRHGIFIFLLYIFFLFHTYKLLFKEIANSDENSLHYHNTIFICMGFTALIVFAVFNVVFENQYEGIFFNFFLSGIYIIRAQKVEQLRIQPHKSFVPMGYVIVLLSAIFILFSFTSFNKVNRIYIYSSKTNYSLPTPPKNVFNRFEITSRKDDGITITPLPHKSNRFSELLWFFPVQANKLNFKEYTLFVESDTCLAGINYFIQYEDGNLVPLQFRCENKISRISLDTLSQGYIPGIKIKYLMILFPYHEGTWSRRFLIKNIYINHN